MCRSQRSRPGSNSSQSSSVPMEMLAGRRFCASVVGSNAPAPLRVRVYASHLGDALRAGCAETLRLSPGEVAQPGTWLVKKDKGLCCHKLIEDHFSQRTLFNGEEGAFCVLMSAHGGERAAWTGSTGCVEASVGARATSVSLSLDSCFPHGYRVPASTGIRAHSLAHHCRPPAGTPSVRAPESGLAGQEWATARVGASLTVLAAFMR